jgi:Raf kinase inhibitor-like YbhB/YbcL family protein
MSDVTNVASERKHIGSPVLPASDRAALAVCNAAGHLPQASSLSMFAPMDLQHTVRCLVRGVPHIVFGGVPAERAGDQRLAVRKLGLAPTGRPALYSDSFADGSAIPREHTAEGQGLPPPPGTRSLALVVEDPDAPTPNPFVHWIVTNIPPLAGTLAQALSRGAKQGRNSMLRTGWTPCAPPKGDETHRYFFQLFALTRELRSGISGRAALLSAIAGRVIASGSLVGTYRRA